ncbi:MFS transporter [Phaeovibrio sulfidiphilus]|uniref:MFS transporter n=1 Tax=Phaeovibrio sulfidiphilus TaxID=1220600 RepID=A0A8J7CBI5_9PROT|nr:MFS transporter [Phaeovibrio sulfidiphilus]MBE1236198.1 MFS transporter [Phaeovibrio sulfidiphilus]
MNENLRSGEWVPKRSVQVYAFIFAFLVLLVDGADLMILSFSLNSLEAEFGLTPTEKGSLASFTLAGMGIGGIIGGWCCDRFGRVRTIVWSTMIFSVGTAVLGFTQSYWEFAILRFLSSLGLGTIYIAATVLMSEYVSGKYRTTILGTLQTGFTFGYIVATFMARWIIPDYGWRWMFFVAIAPVALAAVMRFLVPEPETWHAARRARSARVDAVVRKNTFYAIFADRKARMILLAWILALTALQFGYYGVNNWMPSYLEKELGVNFKSMTSYMIGAYSAMIFGKVLAGIGGDILGRRAVYVLGALGTAICLPAIVYWNTPDNILWLMVAFGFLYGVPFGVLGTYMSESFRTEFRGSAVGAAYNSGRVGGVVAPLLIGYLATNGSIGLGFVVMGGAFLVTAVIPLLFIGNRLHDPRKLVGEPEPEAVVEPARA